jgi:hypothetical protein
MTYAVKDKSIASGAPIECYEFIAPHKTWRYTSYHSPVLVAGQWYYPLPIVRTAIEVTSIIDATATMDFNLPSDHEICVQYCYTISPKLLVVIVRRVHEGDDYSTDFKVEWTGRYAGGASSGKWGILKTASILATELNGFLSSVYYQKTCNHVLYDERCKAVRDDFTESAIITKIQNQIITVDNMVYDDDDLVGGLMTNTRTGEVQGIISNNDNILRIGYPFFDIVLGDTVELTLGCDHQRLGHCKERFNNVDNYGGFDFVPEINPFEKLVYTTSVRTDTNAQGDINYNPPAVGGRSTRVTSGTRRTNSGTSLGYRPRPRPTSSRTSDFGSSSSEGSGNIPQAVLGVAVPAILGRKRVPNHNLLWTGNLRPVTETVATVKTWTEEIDHGGGYIETVTHTETTYTTTTVGYLCDIHLGVCLGPDVHLIGIYVDGSPIWTGDVGPARTEITIPNTGETFLAGSKVYFSGGQFDQAPEPDIDVVDYPGHVGIATVFMKDVRADREMGQLSLEVTRHPNPLALDAGVNKIGSDLNIISALVEVITNEWGYAGTDIAKLDTTTFAELAEVTADEGNVVSVKIDNDVGVNEVIGAIQDQALMVVFENPETGLITGKLIRYDDFSYATVSRFHTGNILEMRNFNKSGWHETIEQARALYTERDANYNEVPVFMQNAANISNSGRGKRTVTFSYPFVPLKALAITLLSRDMAVLAAPQYNFNLLVNRDGASLLPGDYITVTWPDNKLLNLPMQVVSVRKQDIGYNNVVLTLKQARFPDTRALFGPGGDAYDPGFDVDPKTPLDLRVITAPYYMARARNGISSTEVNPLIFPLFLPKPANSFQGSFTGYVNNLPGSLNPVVVLDGAGYPTFGRLTAAIGQYDGFATGELASITIDGVINPAVLSDIGEDGVRAGRLFLIVGNEIMSFESAVDDGGGQWTLSGVHRALVDTVFQAHSDNADVYIMSNNFTNVSRNGFTDPPGYTPEWSIVSNGVTVPGKFEDALVDDVWTQSGMRTLSPPRPHNTKVNGVARSSTPVPITEGDSVTVTWATRSRIATDIKLMLDAAEDAENNGGNVQRHRVYHRSSGGTYTDLGGMAYTGNTATFTMPDVANGVGSIVVISEIILGGAGYTCVYEDRVPVDISPP